MKLMIVDDSPKVISAIKKILSANDINFDKIFEYSNSEDAIENYKNILPDWVLMDINLPDSKTDGLKASQALKELYPQSKIIIITGYDSEEYRDIASEIGVIAYVQKENLSDIPDIINHKFKK